MWKHLRYYLHKLLPEWVEAPKVLGTEKKIIRPKKLISATYSITSMDRYSIDLYLKRLQYNNIPYRTGYTHQSGEEFTSYFQSFELEGEYLEALQSIEVPKGVSLIQISYDVQDQVVVNVMRLKDWSPKNERK